MEELEAGPGLDARIAVEVLGCDVAQERRPGGLCWEIRPGGLGRPLPAYSTDLGAAGELVELLRLNETMVHIHPRLDGYEVAVYAADRGDRVAWAHAPTLALAVCRGTLAAARQREAGHG